jgi:hypothetical protein
MENVTPQPERKLGGLTAEKFAAAAKSVGSSPGAEGLA